MRLKHGKIKILLVMLLTLYFSIGAAIAANSPKTVLSFVKKSDKTTCPAAASTIIKVTDASGQVATYNGTNTTIIAYDDSAGLINISMGNFTAQWKENDSLKIEVTSGTAGTKTFEFGDTTATLDSAPLQTLTAFTLTASKRNMTKTAGDAQSQVFSTVLKKDLEVTVVDDLGDPVKGVTPTAKGDGTITAFTATDSTGKSTATWTLGAAIGPQTMTVSLAGYSDVVFTATATPGPLASYAITDTGFNVKAGVKNTITVTAKDASGNTITNYTGKVSFTSTDTAAALPSDYTFVSGDKGVKNFDVTLKTAGVQTVTVKTGSVAEKMTKTIVPAAASKIKLTTSATTIASNGVGTAVLTATMQDSCGNIATAESGFVTYTVTGTDTSNAGWTTKTATLTKGVATATFTTKGKVGGTGSVTVSVTAGKGAITSSPVTLKIINFSVTPAASNAKIGDKINLTVEGATGTVTWNVTGDAGVGTLGSFAGTNNEKAVFTVAKAGNATITVTEGGKNSTATVAAHNKVAITDKPTTTKTVTGSVTYSATGGDNNFTWTVAGPVAVAGGNGKDFTFKAPTAGAFAGTYTVTVTDSVNTNSDSFNVYVPLTIEPDKTPVSLMSNADPYPFTLTGAANTIPYTVTVTSLGDTKTYTPTTGVFNAQNTATYAFDPADYTVTTATDSKEYTLSFAVKGLTAPHDVNITIVPVTDMSFAGFVTDTNGGPLEGAAVTITSPAGFRGRTATTDVTGAFAFNNLTTVDNTVFGFKAEKTGYIRKEFKSTDLAKDGKTEISLKTAGSSVSGTVTESVRGAATVSVKGSAKARVTIFDKDGKVDGPIDTAANGDFCFNLPTAYSSPVDYTITASATGYSGYTTITADSQDYTGVSVVLAPVGPSDYTVTAANKPTGNNKVDAKAGGTLDFSADNKLAGDVKKAFGTNDIKIVISPVKDGKVVVAALPEPKTYTDNTIPVKSGIKWEIAGLGQDCVTIPVPCTLAEALAVSHGTKTVWYQHTKVDGTVGDWTPVTVAKDKIFFNGDHSLIEVDICDWSSNVVGIGSSPSSPSTSSSDSDSSGCFISSLSTTGTSGNMMALFLIFAIIAGGILLSINRKRKIN